MARYRRSRDRGFLCCLVCFSLYLLTIDDNHRFFSSWSSTAVRRVQKWEGHRLLSLLVVVPAVCGDLVPAFEESCLHHVSKVCPGFATRPCNNQGTTQSVACNKTLLHRKASNDIRHGLITPFRRVLPHLLELGWTKPQILQDDAKSLAAAIKHADVVICTLQTFHRHSRSKSHFVVIDETLEGKLDFVDLELLQNSQVLAVLKPHVVTTPVQRRSQAYRPLAGPHKKVHALIPLFWLWAFPLDCGASPNYLRYTGFFQPALAGWDRSKLWQRSIDVVLLSSNADKDSPGYAHHRLATLELRRLQERLPDARIATQLPDNYDQYLDKYLMDAKVVVSVLQPSSEVSLQDYEAWLAGCILVKPRAKDILAYPNAFQSGYTVYDVNVDFSNVADVVIGILQDLEKAQSMVDRTTAMLRKHARLAQFAVDLDEILEMSIKESISLG
ncbi:hypothetical protein ABBQ32_008267 [Trebouxia sp. C0010 RCD-2024]